MKSRIGIVGPKDSVNIISEVAKEFNSQITPLPFKYSHIEQTKNIVIENQNKVDVWLFTGQAPYAIAKEFIKANSGFFPSLNGSSLTKVLLDISYKDNQKLSYLSFDTILKSEVFETFSELELPTKNLALFQYSGFKPTEELVKFHYSLYKQNKVNCCITGIHEVYNELKRMNLPAYRVIPTKMAIRETLKIATQRSEAIQFQSSQIAILVLQINNMNQLISKSDVSYDAHRLNLKLQEAIIEFSEKIQGSFIQQGIDKFIIFSTRGTLKNQNNSKVFHLIERINMVTNLPANLGIGYGRTVLEAEQNAYLALNHANEYKNNSIVSADEKGNIKGPLQNKKNISFNRHLHDEKILKKLNLAGINVSTYNKAIAIQERLNQQAISANELAQWLDMTPRNARRILGNLETQGLAKIVGSETPNTRGRPRRVFKIIH